MKFSSARVDFLEKFLFESLQKLFELFIKVFATFKLEKKTFETILISTFYSIFKLSPFFLQQSELFFAVRCLLKALLSPTYERKSLKSGKVPFTFTTHLPWSNLKYEMRHNLIRVEDVRKGRIKRAVETEAFC